MAQSRYKAGGRARRPCPGVQGVDRLVHGLENFGHADCVGGFGQPVAAARAACGGHDAGAAQLDEKLLEIGQGDVLTLRDLAQGDQLIFWRKREVGQRNRYPQRPADAGFAIDENGMAP